MFTRQLSRHTSKKHVRYLTKITGLPFEITRRDVGKILVDNKGFFERTNPGDVEKKHKESKANIANSDYDPITKKFLPFHSVDVSNLSTSFTGQCGYDRTEIYFVPVYNGKTTTIQTRTRTVTDWCYCHGSVPNGSYPLGETLETQIYAGFEYPRKYVSKIMRSKKVSKIHDFNVTKESKLSSHDMKIKYANEKITVEICKFEEQRVHNYIRNHYNCDRSRIITFDVGLHKANYNVKSYHLPVWEYKFSTDGKNSFHKIINGFNGRVSGDKIESPTRKGIFWGVMGLLGGASTLLTLSNPMLTAANIIARTAIPALVMGGGSALWTKNTADNLEYVNKHKIKKDVEHNDTIDETEYDVYAKGLVDNHLENAYQEEINNMYLLLGINDSTNMTLKKLKKHYRNEIMKWHPDIYQGDNLDVAKHMTRQLNNANKKLREHIISIKGL